MRVHYHVVVWSRESWSWSSVMRVFRACMSNDPDQTKAEITALWRARDNGKS